MAISLGILTQHFQTNPHKSSFLFVYHPIFWEGTRLGSRIWWWRTFSWGSDLWLTWRIIPSLSDTRPGKRLQFAKWTKHFFVRSIKDFDGSFSRSLIFCKFTRPGIWLSVFVGLIKAMGDGPPGWFQRGIMMKQRMKQWWQPIFGEHQFEPTFVWGTLCGGIG